jgi:hypothetical protein
MDPQAVLHHQQLRQPHRVMGGGGVEARLPDGDRGPMHQQAIAEVPQVGHHQRQQLPLAAGGETLGDDAGEPGREGTVAHLGPRMGADDDREQLLGPPRPARRDLAAALGKDLLGGLRQRCRQGIGREGVHGRG